MRLVCACIFSFWWCNCASWAATLSSLLSGPKTHGPNVQSATCSDLNEQTDGCLVGFKFCLFPPFALVFCVAPLFDNFNASGVVLDALGVLFVVSVLSCFCRCFAMSWVQTEFLFMFGIAEILRTRLYWNVSFFCDNDFFFQNNFRLHKYFFPAIESFILCMVEGFCLCG